MEVRRVIADAALKIANLTDANAIILLSEENILQSADTTIPILHITKSSIQFKDLVTSDPSSGCVSKDLYAKSKSDTQWLEESAAVANIKGIISEGHIVGVVEFENAYSILYLDTKESELFKKLNCCSARVDPEVTQAVLGIALKLAVEGYEGRSIGTAFIIGDTEEVLKRSYQSVINPFEGHNVNIKDPSNWSSMKGFAQLDGMFIIDEDGKVLNAGRYIESDTKDIAIQKGLGGRHIAAAIISYETQALAITLSQSGTVRLFKDGVAIIKFESDTII
ncbi:MAG: diadenylate cyclase [Halobacteriota archaeon]|nr:diadenylate cyclase [Halobacteriota archaeon]